MRDKILHLAISILSNNPDTLLNLDISVLKYGLFTFDFARGRESIARIPRTPGESRV